MDICRIWLKRNSQRLENEKENLIKHMLYCIQFPIHKIVIIYIYTHSIYPDTKIAISIKWTENRKSLCFDLTRKNRLANQSTVQHDISHQWCYTFYTDEIPLIHEIQRIPPVLIAIHVSCSELKKNKKGKKKYKNFLLLYKNVQNNSSFSFHVKFNAINYHLPSFFQVQTIP